VSSESQRKNPLRDSHRVTEYLEALSQRLLECRIVNQEALILHLRDKKEDKIPQGVLQKLGGAQEPSDRAKKKRSRPLRNSCPRRAQEEPIEEGDR
jgi:hypothetical protein